VEKFASVVREEDHVLVLTDMIIDIMDMANVLEYTSFGKNVRFVVFSKENIDDVLTIFGPQKVFLVEGEYKDVFKRVFSSLIENQ